MEAETLGKLVLTARDGDLRAFEELYRHFRPKIHHAVYHLLGDTDETSDIVSRAFVRAWQSIGSLEQPKAFGGWLRRIAINLVRDHWRSHQPLDALPDDDDPEPLADSQPDPLATTQYKIEANHLRMALLELPILFREPVVLHYLDDLSVEETASILDLPKGTILSRLSRARKRLRLILETQEKVRS